MTIDWEPLQLTFRLACITTLLLGIIALPLAYWLAYSTARFKAGIAAMISLPLILPPTVLGFYLLLLLSPGNPLGQWLDQWLGLRLVFSFEGLVLASVLSSLPFMVHPIQSGLAALPRSLSEAAYVLGESKTMTLFKVLLPNIKPSLLTGAVLTFAHTVGEFGVVLMIGGNIPGETRVAAIALYDEVEALRYEAAHTYALILVVLSFTILLIVYGLNGKNFTRRLP